MSLISEASTTADRFNESLSLLNLSSDAKMFAAGTSFSRTDDPLDENLLKYFSMAQLMIWLFTTVFLQLPKFLYSLRTSTGREQNPKTGGLVDAIGTVEINEGGAGIENPDLVFWYGQNDENESNLQAFDSIDDVNDFYHDVNGDFNGTGRSTGLCQWFGR